jgi:hypothetical protein
MPAAHKYLMQVLFDKKAPLYRLTLTAEAFVLAVQRSKPIAGVSAVARVDGGWDVMVTMATADQLNQHRLEGEHLTDVVVRLLRQPR